MAFYNLFFPDVLPVIEFQLEPAIEDEEAQALILVEESPDGHSTGGQGRDATKSASSQWEEEMATNFQSLKFNEESDFYDNAASDANATGARQDPFMTKISTSFEDGAEFSPVVVSRAILRQINPSEVMVCKLPPPLKTKYFKNLVPDMNITTCTSCHKVGP